MGSFIMTKAIEAQDVLNSYVKIENWHKAMIFDNAIINHF